MKKGSKAKVYLASPVFREIAENHKVSHIWKREIAELYDELSRISHVFEARERFPDGDTIKKEVEACGADFIGCHLSHPITAETLSVPSVKAVATSTAGYNHIELKDDIIVTHTPSVLDKAVADFTIAAILNNLRDISGLHNYVWNGEWKPGEKWDLDSNLSNSMDNLTLGIVGLGEIGRELVRRLAPWGIRIIYHSRTEKAGFQKEYPMLQYVDDPESIFAEADIVSIHLPLDEKTKHFVDENRLQMMKKGSTLVNTARGEVVDFQALIRLLIAGEIHINLVFDVFDPEPLPGELLERFKMILRKRPELKFTFLPHNASADADTRAQMSVMMLKDLIALAGSGCIEDLNGINLIPQQRHLFESKNANLIRSYRIKKYWT